MKKIKYMFVLFVCFLPMNVFAEKIVCRYRKDIGNKNTDFVPVFNVWRESSGNFSFSNDVDFDKRAKGFKELYDNKDACPSVIYVCAETIDSLAIYSITSSDVSDVKPFTKCVLYNLLDADPGLIEEPNDPGDVTCEGVFSAALLDKLQEYFNIFKIVVPILVVVLGILDFAKVILGSDDDGMKKAQQTFIKRLILAVLFFLLPIFLNVILNLINSSVSTCGIG